MTGLDAARAAKERLRAELAGEPSLAGIGVGREAGGYVVRVSFATAAHPDVPAVVDGVPVRSAVVGRVRPLPGAARP